MKGCVIWLSGVVLKVDDSSLLQGEKSYKNCLFHRVLELKLFKSDLILGMYLY